MGVTMRPKKARTNGIATRYRMQTKVGRQVILDGFCRTTGDHRKYAVQLLK